VFWRHRGVSRAAMLSTFVVGVSVRQNIRAKRSRRLWSSASLLHDERAALADRAEYVQHGRADLQIHPPTVTPTALATRCNFRLRSCRVKCNRQNGGPEAFLCDGSATRFLVISSREVAQSYCGKQCEIEADGKNYANLRRATWNQKSSMRKIPPCVQKPKPLVLTPVLRTC
jgi:hypothetical protein